MYTKRIPASEIRDMHPIEYNKKFKKKRKIQKQVLKEHPVLYLLTLINL